MQNGQSAQNGDNGQLKLVIIIASDADAEKLTRKLIEQGYPATKVSSTGGFLRKGNATILSGVEASEVDGIVAMVRSECYARTEYAPVQTLPFFGEGSVLQEPIEVRTGGAIVFVLNVERFEEDQCFRLHYTDSRYTRPMADADETASDTPRPARAVAIPPEMLARIRRIEIRARRLVANIFLGEYHSVFRGRGIEFSEVRQYEPGDDVRAIDWNVTARMGPPYIKKYIEERELTVLLAVDLSASSSFTTADLTKRELAAEVAATLAFAAVANNDRVGLLTFTDRVERYIPPGKNRRHVLRIVRELLYTEPQGRGTDIAAAIRYLGRVSKRRAIVFVLSDFFDQGYERQLRAAAARHEVIAITLNDRARVRAARCRPARAAGRRDRRPPPRRYLGRRYTRRLRRARGRTARPPPPRACRRRRRGDRPRHRALVRRAAAPRLPLTAAAPRAPDLRVGVCVIRLGLKTEPNRARSPTSPATDAPMLTSDSNERSDRHDTLHLRALRQ